MRKIIAVVMFTALVFLSPARKAAASGLCCQLSSGVQESLAGVAAPGTEEVSMQLNYSFTRMDQIKEGGRTRSLDEARSYKKPDGTSYTTLPLSMDMMRYTLTAGYGFTPKFKAFVSIPYVRNTMDMTASNGALLGWTDMTMPPVSGLGDVTVMGLYRVYTDREIRPANAVTIGLGVKTPTGSSTKRTESGKFVHAHMQPGTGSWDPLFSIIDTKMMGSFLIQADATYQLATRNKEGYKFGDSLAATFTGKYAVVREFNVLAGLTYLHVNKASDRNGKYYDPVTNSSLMDDPANTGGDSLWGSVGVQILSFRNGIIDVKAQLPLWERVNGIQLVSSFLISAGISYSF
ncbi:MAG TPA: transporter [Nitrospirota bacterium]|nr:transporter [Nitrospirota bacterium]